MRNFVLILFLYFTNIVSAQETSLIPYKTNFNLLKNWTSSFVNFKLSDFKNSKENVKFDNIEKQNFKDLNSFLNIYRPIIAFSKSGNQFIDIYSYQLNLEKKGNHYVATTDIDQAIYLCNLKTKYWNRIFFGSFSNWIDEVLWISETKFILVGVENINDQNFPKIYVGNISNQTFEVFINQNKTCVQKIGIYKSQKLKKINIK